MRKHWLAPLLIVPFALGITSPAHAAASLDAIAAASHPRVDDLREWQQAWQGLSAEDRKTLEQSWTAVANAFESLTPAQRKELRAATKALIKRLSAKYRSLDEAQQRALQDAFQRWADAYQALDAADKQAALETLAADIESLKSASAAAKATLQALVDALG